MKSIYLILPISLLLLTTTCSSEPVLDVDGNPVETQYPYYILPSTRGSGGGGGITQGPRNSSALCPFYVIQEDLEASRGLPVRFKPVNPNDKVLNESTDMNVAFAAATTCVQSTVWRLGGAEEGRRRYVESGGVAGSPGVGTVSNWFRVERKGKLGIYKMVFCPGVCSECRVECGDVGVFWEFGKRFLGFSGSSQPLLVVFKRALNF